MQFLALFDELKKEGSEWPTFGTRHEYWNKAAVFVQETTGTEFLINNSLQSRFSVPVPFQRQGVDE